jgi:hypothetical protein
MYIGKVHPAIEGRLIVLITAQPALGNVWACILYTPCQCVTPIKMALNSASEYSMSNTTSSSLDIQGGHQTYLADFSQK